MPHRPVHCCDKALQAVHHAGLRVELRHLGFEFSLHRLPCRFGCFAQLLKRLRSGAAFLLGSSKRVSCR